jgi:hypothetical protein
LGEGPLPACTDSNTTPLGSVVFATPVRAPRLGTLDAAPEVAAGGLLGGVQAARQATPNADMAKDRKRMAILEGG